MDRNYKALELDKVLELLEREISSKESAYLVQELKPAEDIDQVKLLMEETDAAFVLSAKFGSPSFYGLKNISNASRRAQAGGSLGMKELLEVGSSLRTFRALKQWRQRNAGVKTPLDGRFSLIIPNKTLEDRIFTSIKSEEEMEDEASPQLAGIRRKIRNTGTKIRDNLDKLIRSQTHKKHLQDAIVTMRSGRYVVPVKAEYRGEVQGLVHDTSSSGATLFIEPMSVVEANNEIRLLQAQEREEIDRILLELSALVGDIAEELSESFIYSTQLDLIFAKANLAYKMKAVVPKLNDEGRIDLKAARHPLISKDKVVPIDVNLGKGFDTLIVTGPNTGGKTVAIKTIGLLTLMAMCGLMIPAVENSEISVFKKVLADIGDEQSIEQSLSTFSAHMTNIIRILKQADEGSLVLMDELGAGTDPVEGAALAMAIIEELRQMQVKMACTTHYAELKAYAIQTQGVENACCEFDVATLMPTYRLLIGVPGKSNAFAISSKLGISDHVIDRAKSFVSGSNSAFEEVVGKLEDSRKRLEDEMHIIKEERRQAQRQAAEAMELKKQAESRAQKDIEQARQEAQQLVSKTKARANAMLNELEEIKKQQNRAQTAEYKEKMRRGMRQLDDLSNPVNQRKSENYVMPRELKPGDEVLIYDIDKKAVVLEKPKDGNVLVQAGLIKTRVDIKNLRLLGEKGGVQSGGQPRQRTVTKNISQQGVSTDVDLRGKTADEALMELDSAIDLAQLRGIKRLTIIHGKGTGVLRSAVQQHLRKSQSVSTFRLGSYGEGESGVTIAELK